MGQRVSFEKWNNHKDLDNHFIAERFDFFIDFCGAFVHGIRTIRGMLKLVFQRGRDVY